MDQRGLPFSFVNIQLETILFWFVRKIAESDY